MSKNLLQLFYKKVQKKINLDEKIFLAGANGMVGNSIYRTLIKKGYGNKINGGEIYSPNRKELDLLDVNLVKKWFEKHKPSVVIIAAAKVGGILANSKYPTEFLLENLKIQTNIIETSWRFGVKRLIFLGSSCIYPKLAEQPIKEKYLLQGELETTNQWYAIAKITGIKMCEALRKQYGFDAISLMPTNLYGPKDNYHPQNSHVMAALIRKFYEASLKKLPRVTCWGSGSPYREFLHVDDLSDAILYILENFDTENDQNVEEDLSLINIGTGKDISIKELAEKIASLTEYKGEIYWDRSKPDGTKKKQLDISRIRKLGWEAKIGLEEGILKTIESFKKEHYAI